MALESDLVVDAGGPYTWDYAAQLADYPKLNGTVFAGASRVKWSVDLDPFDCGPIESNSKLDTRYACSNTYEKPFSFNICLEAYSEEQDRTIQDCTTMSVIPIMWPQGTSEATCELRSCLNRLVRLYEKREAQGTLEDAQVYFNTAKRAAKFARRRMYQNGGFSRVVFVKLEASMSLAIRMMYYDSFDKVWFRRITTATSHCAFKYTKDILSAFQGTDMIDEKIINDGMTALTKWREYPRDLRRAKSVSDFRFFMTKFLTKYLPEAGLSSTIPMFCDNS